MRMRPAQDVDLLPMMQSVGTALTADTSFGPGLDELRRDIQSRG